MPQRKKNPEYLVNLWALIGAQVEQWVSANPPRERITGSQLKQLVEFILFFDVRQFDNPHSKTTTYRFKIPGSWKSTSDTSDQMWKKYRSRCREFARVQRRDSDFVFELASHVRSIWNCEESQWVSKKFIRMTGHLEIDGKRRFILDCYDDEITRAINRTHPAVQTQTVKKARQKIASEDKEFLDANGEGPWPGPSQRYYG
jgi:hypothetical protein